VAFSIVVVCMMLFTASLLMMSSTTTSTATFVSSRCRLLIGVRHRLPQSLTGVMFDFCGSGTLFHYL
jgi:hypothetical protein